MATLSKSQKDIFRELNIKIPESYIKLKKACDEKIDKMIDKGWDTGNDPANLATYQKWETLRAQFPDEKTYDRYLDDRIKPIIGDFISAVDLGGWIKSDELEERVTRMAPVFNIERVLVSRLLHREITNRKLKLTKAAPAPIPVKNLQIAIARQTLTLSWQNCGDCDHLIVCRRAGTVPSPAPDKGQLKKLPGSATGFSHILTLGDMGVPFVYTVFSCRDQGKASATSIAACCPAQIDKDSVKIRQKYDEITIGWREPGKQTRYIVKLDNVDYPCSHPPFCFKLSQSKLYHYEIVAVFPGEAYSQAICGQFRFIAPPTKITDFCYEIKQNDIEFQWQSLVGTGWRYRMARAENTDLNNPVIIWESERNSMREPSDSHEKLLAQPGQSYYYAVFPYHSEIWPFSTAESRRKMPVTIIGPLMIPSEVQGLSAKQYGHQIQLYWSKIPGTPRYKIFKKKQNSQEFVLCKESGAENYCDDDPHSGINHYRVAVQYGNNLSEGEHLSLNYHIPPSPPRDFCAHSRRNKIILEWRKNSEDITCYQLYRSETKQFKNAQLLATLPPQTFDFEDCGENFTSGHFYYYFLFAMNHTACGAKPALCGPVLGYDECDYVLFKQKNNQVSIIFDQIPSGVEKILFLFDRQHPHFAIGPKGPICHSSESRIVESDGKIILENLEAGPLFGTTICRYPRNIYSKGQDVHFVIKPLPTSPQNIRAQSYHKKIILSWDHENKNLYFAICRDEQEIAVVNDTHYCDDQLPETGKKYRYQVYSISEGLRSKPALVEAISVWNIVFAEWRQHKKTVELIWENVGQQATWVMRTQEPHVHFPAPDSPQPENIDMKKVEGCRLREKLEPGFYHYAFFPFFGEKSFGGRKNLTVEIKPLPASPKKLRVQRYHRSIILSWRAGDLAENYGIMRFGADDPLPSPGQWHTVVGTPVFEDREIESGTHYRYAIYAMTEHLYSEKPLLSETILAYGEVEHAKVKLHPEMIELAWRKPALVQDIWLYRCLPGKPWQKIADGLDSGYLDGEIEERYYNYRIVCLYHDREKGTFSTPGIVFEVSAYQEPETITDLQCRHRGNRIDLTWKGPARKEMLIVKSRTPLASVTALSLSDLQQRIQKRSLEKIVITAPYHASDYTSEQKIYYYPFVIIRNKLYPGSPALAYRVSEVEGVLRGYYRGQTPGIYLEWDWPHDLTRVRICRTLEYYSQGPDDPGAEIWDISRSDYFGNGYFVDDRLPKMPDGRNYHYTIYRALAEKKQYGVFYYSPGESKHCRFAICFAGAVIPIHIVGQSFQWQKPLQLDSVRGKVRGDFQIAWTIEPEYPDSWKKLPEIHNIFKKTEGKVLISEATKHYFARIMWLEPEDKDWFATSFGRKKR